MKKIVSLALVAVMLFCCLAFIGCAPKANVETYTRSYAFYEEGREGDVIDGVVCDLTFVNDKEYLYTETTVIAHIGAGKQVTNWTYSFKGTYTVGATDEEETTKVINRFVKEHSEFEKRGEPVYPGSGDSRFDGFFAQAIERKKV